VVTTTATRTTNRKEPVMSLLSRKTTATALDTAASNLYRVGLRIAGPTGGKVGDALAGAVLGPVRSRIDTPCTCGKPDCPQHTS
jgi:hypothetical protein